MMPHFVDPEKKPNKFKEQLKHHLKMFRFSNRTKISTQHDLSEEDYFSPHSSSSSDKDVKRIEFSKPLREDKIRAKAS
jgi:hypothetical protein